MKNFKLAGCVSLKADGVKYFLSGNVKGNIFKPN